MHMLTVNDKLNITFTDHFYIGVCMHMQLYHGKGAAVDAADDQGAQRRSSQTIRRLNRLVLISLMLNLQHCFYYCLASMSCSSLSDLSSLL